LDHAILGGPNFTRAILTILMPRPEDCYEHAEAQRQYGVGDEDQYSDKRVTGQPKAKHREW